MKLNHKFQITGLITKRDISIDFLTDILNTTKDKMEYQEALVLLKELTKINDVAKMHLETNEKEN